jgi:pimeloyl-ACP methyl ester carboxylesterase
LIVFLPKNMVHPVTIRVRLVMILRICSLALALAFGWAIACHAQLVSSAFEEHDVPKLGPQAAEGLLIYLHGRGGWDIDKDRIPSVLIAMAKIAKWDVLRVIRVPFVDIASEDDNQREFIGREVDRAHGDGYRKIYVAGGSRGGWLALVSAALDSVDGVIAMAPSTTTDLAWQRDELARRLSLARTKRIAVFFFEGDPREEVLRSETTRQALQISRSAYMLVDRPPGLLGHSAGMLGRFTRRYRDCLLQFMRSDEVQPGEVPCPADRGYAVGDDIGFPPAEPRALGEPFSVYSGRWQGDNEHGAYAIFQPIEPRGDELVAHVALSPRPEQSHRQSWFHELMFRQARSGLDARLSWPKVLLRVNRKSETALELDLLNDEQSVVSSFLLRRQSER